MRLGRRLSCAAAALAVMLCCTGALAEGTAPYKGAIAMDAATGNVLFENNADTISPPASMTKLMTFAVVDDDIRSGRLGLDTPVTATREAAKVGAMRDSTVVWLHQGETFPVEELIYAMMIQSANDAAYALAQKSAGSVADFVARMNAKAREIGMTHTTFRTPNGFPVPSHRIADGDLTSPRDFALLSRYLLLRTNILKYTSVKQRPFGISVRREPVVMTNHNHLLGKIEGVDGLKTGFTDGAGFCLAATAQRGSRRVIVVMMGCTERKTRDLAVADLLSTAFERLPVMGAAPFPSKAAPQAQSASPVQPAPLPTSPTRPAPQGPVIVYPSPLGR